MSTQPTPTAWKNLYDRRKEILSIIQNNWKPGDMIRTADVNQHLSDDNQTTTKMLTILDEEDNYIERVQTGGGPLLVAYIPNDNNKTATSPSKQKKLAYEMVNREGLSLDPDRYNWSSPNRKRFVAEFNARASNISLRATWTCNYYEITPNGYSSIKKYNKN